MKDYDRQQIVMKGISKMSTMQTFYSRILASPKKEDTYFAILGRLTRCTLKEVAAVKSEMIWELWASQSS